MSKKLRTLTGKQIELSMKRWINWNSPWKIAMMTIMDEDDTDSEDELLE